MITDLEKLEALCAAATPGPWPIWVKWPDMPEYVQIDPVSGPPSVNAHGDWPKPDVEFVSAAREALPTLIAEVRRLREGLKKILAYGPPFAVRSYAEEALSVSTG